MCYSNNSDNSNFNSTTRNTQHMNGDKLESGHSKCLCQYCSGSPERRKYTKKQRVKELRRKSKKILMDAIKMLFG